LIKGWARLFAQRSTDHRGTPEGPGLVATLCEVSVLESLPGFDAAAIPDETLGRAYVVPDDEAPRVLAELDFREKGGYVPSRETPQL
jgi:cation transport regulator ChaC